MLREEAAVTTHLLDRPRKRLHDSSSFPGGGFSTSKHCSVHLSLVPVEKGAFGCWESPGPCSLQGSIEMCQERPHTETFYGWTKEAHFNGTFH